jgi:predicted dehydrogenase
MPEKIKVALATHAGGAHLGAYFSALAATDEVDTVALVDPSGQSNAAAKKALGDKLSATYDGVGKMLKAFQPVLTLVTMEAATAPPTIAHILEGGSHVFAEKPSCVNAKDFRRLTALADGKHLNLMLALANRLNPEVQRARRLIEDGDIGKVYGVDMHLIADQTRLTRPSYHKTWFAKKDRSGGGHLIWLGIHWLDLAVFITGAKIKQVAGFTANVGGQPIDIEDSAAASLQFDNGTLGTLTSGYYLDRGYHSHIKIWGSSGWLHLEQMKDKPLHWYSTRGKNKGQVQEFDGSKQPRGYTQFVQAAVRACAGLQEPPISNADSLHAIETVYAIYDAANKGHVQSVSTG